MALLRDLADRVERIATLVQRGFATHGLEPYPRGELAPPTGEPCPIAWQPSPTAPVFYGTHDVEPPVINLAFLRPAPVRQDPPGIFRVFFPSVDGSPPYAPVLEPCGRYPLLAFLHGHCSADAPFNYTKWYELPARLASCGYVVVVPHLRDTGTGVPPITPNHQDIARVLAILRWMRSDWAYARVLMPQPATGIIGHSFGGVLGARIALEQLHLAEEREPSIRIAAYVSLSGAWHDIGPPPWYVHHLPIPKLFLWGTDDRSANLTDGNLWQGLPPRKHAAIVPQARHWDYLSPARRSACAMGRGPCPMVGLLSADIIAAFLGKYLPPEHWPQLATTIPDSLVATLDMPASFDRQFFAGNHLMSIPFLDQHPEGPCTVELRWATPTGVGEEVHGMPLET